MKLHELKPAEVHVKNAIVLDVVLRQVTVKQVVADTKVKKLVQAVV